MPTCTWPDGGCARERAEANPCQFPDCTESAIALGWCMRHYQRNRRYGDPTAIVGRLRRPEYGVLACHLCGAQRNTLMVDYPKGGREWVCACVKGCDTPGFWLDEVPATRVERERAAKAGRS
jgi:hypothetical protein